MMMRNLFRNYRPLDPVQPRVAPDPRRAAELELKRSRLAYAPENTFHRDRVQPRVIPIKRKQK